MHGEYRHLIAQAKIAESLGIPKENIIILRSGNVLEMDQKSAKVTGNVPTGAIMVDGLGVGDIGNAVLRDRQHLAEDGIVIVSFAMDSEDQVVGTPEIASRGFVYIKEAEALMNGATLVVQKTLDDAEKRGITDRNRIRTLVKDALSDFFWKKTERRPMILPMILEV